MPIDDICTAITRLVKDNFSGYEKIQIAVNAKGCNNRVCIVAERGRSGEPRLSIILKFSPYVVILLLGCMALWGLLGTPGCRPKRVVTYTENQSCSATNRAGGTIKFNQKADGCITDKWE